MRKPCAVCGDEFEAKTVRAKYCSGRCKKREADARSRGASVVDIRRARPDRSAEPESGLGIGAGMIAEFSDDLLDSTMGRIAVRLARDIDESQPGIPGYGAIMKELVTIVERLEGRSNTRSANPLVLLRERRAADRASG